MDVGWLGVMHMDSSSAELAAKDGAPCPGLDLRGENATKLGDPRKGGEVELLACSQRRPCSHLH